MEHQIVTLSSSVSLLCFFVSIGAAFLTALVTWTLSDGLFVGMGKFFISLLVFLFVFLAMFGITILIVSALVAFI